IAVLAPVKNRATTVWSVLWTLLHMITFAAGIWCHRTAGGMLIILVAGGGIAALSAASGIVQALSPGSFSDLVYPFLPSDYQVSMAYAVGQLGRYTSAWGQPTPYAMPLSMFLPSFGLIASAFTVSSGSWRLPVSLSRLWLCS
ncbi:MAG: hypothetical protein M1305_06805, partial [Candidatus Marsarchaeota archaeon]|nr:hypothetical protein [Candidatus Marsarchaeota archaeon]